MATNIIFSSVCFTLFLIFTSSSKVSLEFNVVAWIFLVYFFLILGVCFSRLVSQSQPNKIFLEQRAVKEDRVSFLAGWLGLVAFALRFLDKFIVREASLSLNFSETLSQLQDKGSTVLGLATAPFLFLCMFPYIASFRKKTPSLFWAIVFWLPAVDALFFGQRFVLLLSMFVFCMANLVAKKSSIKSFLKIFFIVFAGVSIAAYVINSRYAGYGVDVYYSLKNSAYAELLILPDFLHGSDSLILGLLFNILFYFQHGIYEFQLAMNTGNYSYTYGAFNFPAFLKIFEPLELFPDPWSGFSRKGIYLSFFGCAWFDFSIFSLPLVFLMGYILKESEKSYKQSKGTCAFLMFSFLSYVIILMPVTSTIGYGFGNYVITSFVFYKMLIFVFSLKFKQPITDLGRGSHE